MLKVVADCDQLFKITVCDLERHIYLFSKYHQRLGLKTQRVDSKSFSGPHLIILDFHNTNAIESTGALFSLSSPFLIFPIAVFDTAHP